MTDLIEGYLRAAGVQYFRGHHDGEYVFLVDYPAPVSGRTVDRHGKLHVHLRGLDRTELQISITPDRYYPVAHRDRLEGLTARWGFAAAAGAARWAEVYDSCDPALVGVAAYAQGRPDGIEGVAVLVEGTICAATELFAGFAHRITAQRTAELRDAG